MNVFWLLRFAFASSLVMYCVEICMYIYIVALCAAIAGAVASAIPDTVVILPASVKFDVLRTNLLLLSHSYIGFWSFVQLVHWYIHHFIRWPEEMVVIHKCNPLYKIFFLFLILFFAHCFNYIQMYTYVVFCFVLFSKNTSILVMTNMYVSNGSINKCHS